MQDYGSLCGWASESCRRRLAALALAAAIVLALPGTALGYRRGLATALGGAPLGQGHLLWLQAGFPSTQLGWDVGLHPLVDFGLSAAVVYSDPTELAAPMVGGGGGARLRVALLRGRASLGATVEVGATAYPESTGVAALLDLGSPSLLLSYRFSERVAAHASIQVVLQYITAPARFVGGFEGGGGVTIGLTEQLALTVSAAVGTSIASDTNVGTARLSAHLGLEYRLGGAGGAPDDQ